MNNNNTLHTILLLCAIALMTMAFFAVYTKAPKVVTNTDTVIVTKTDTFVDTFEVQKVKLVPKKIVETKHDTITKDTVLETVQKYYQERFYLGKDTADVGVIATGINPSVDSIGIKLRTRHTVTTNTVEIVKYVEKEKAVWDRFHFGVQGGIGYGITQKKCDIYIGFGGTFDL